MKRMLLCAEANRIDLVDFLQTLGYLPQKIRGDDYWYLSPFRAEKTPSFKVNRKLNLWCYHGLGKGGNLVDFGLQFFGCSIPELLQKLDERMGLNLSFHPPVYPTPSALNREEKKLTIKVVGPIFQPHFFRYLAQRKIDVDIAKLYLNEVSFELHKKTFTALGFRNGSGGYELRNEYFKGSSSPKDVTVINQASTDLAVFEGCFSFLSYLSFLKRTASEYRIHLPERPTNYLVLNSLSFFEKCRDIMESYSSIFLYLDRDVSGLRVTRQALRWSPKYKDRSALYEGFKDVNDYLVQSQKIGQKQSLGRGRPP